MKRKDASIKSNLKKLDSISDDAIDYTDIPATDDEDWASAEVFMGGKQAISLRVDADVLAFFKQYGKGYQTAMNRVLRQYMNARKSRSG